MDYGKLISSHYLNKEVSTLGKRFNYQQTDEYKPGRRSNLTAKLRKEVFNRDGGKCVKCGSPDDLHIHHIELRCVGGTDSITNLQTLCKYCHSDVHKGSFGSTLLTMCGDERIEDNQI